MRRHRRCDLARSGATHAPVTYSRMGWDRGRYYSRSRRVNGRVVREYVGAGAVAELIAAKDAERRAERIAAAAHVAAADETAARALDAVEVTLDGLARTADAATRAALEGLGFRRHRR